MQQSTSHGHPQAFLTTHPLESDDASTIAAIKAAARATKGASWTAGARGFFDGLMERVSPRADVRFESGTVGGIPGLWVHPPSHRSAEALLYVHGGWFHAGGARPYRHLVAHLAAMARTSAFVADYRLAPEHPFPAAIDDVLAASRGLAETGFGRIGLAGDSAGGNLALLAAAGLSADAVSVGAVLVGVAALSPVTDLTLSGASYETRAEADPFFTRSQVAELVRSYLREADARDPLASPLYGRLKGLPPVRIHVGDDEVLLDDARRYVERAVAEGVDARLDVWMGMPHGFVSSIGTIKASARALEVLGRFLAERLRSDAAGP
jgi:epsilon-lactone hydrolase